MYELKVIRSRDSIWSAEIEWTETLVEGSSFYTEILQKAFLNTLGELSNDWIYYAEIQKCAWFVILSWIYTMSTYTEATKTTSAIV